MTKIVTSNASGVASSNGTANGPIFALFIIAALPMMFEPFPTEIARKAAM